MVTSVLGHSLAKAIAGAPVERRIRVALTVTGVRQVDLAARLGLKTSRLNHIVTGRTVPDAVLATRIAEALGTSVEVLWSSREIA